LLEVKNKFVKIEELFNSAISLANKNNEKINIANIKSQERKLNQSQNIYYAVLHNYDIKTVQSALKELINEDKTKCFVFVLLSELDIKYISMVNSSNIVNCKELINKINLLSNGKGGGNDIYAQGSTKDINSIDQIINLISEQ
jgi:alanyl-tRNA synthetase